MNVFWTRRSKTRFQEISEFITVKFGDQSSEKFRNKVFNFIELLERFPELGMMEVPEKNIRGFQVSKQTRIFYRINKDHISLLTFFDSRQNPNKKPK